MNTTFYIVSFALDLTGGLHGREFSTRTEAEAFAASLVGTDAYDVEVEEVRDPGELVLVQIGPAL
jgi:hypothetical protein